MDSGEVVGTGLFVDEEKFVVVSYSVLCGDTKTSATISGQIDVVVPNVGTSILAKTKEVERSGIGITLFIQEEYAVGKRSGVGFVYRVYIRARDDFAADVEVYGAGDFGRSFAKPPAGLIGGILHADEVNGVQMDRVTVSINSPIDVEAGTRVGVGMVVNVSPRVGILNVIGTVSGFIDGVVGEKSAGEREDILRYPEREIRLGME
jgi:hypothetical protein